MAGAWSIGDAVDGRSQAVRVTVMVAAWSVWGIGVVALVVPSPLGLTVMRMLCVLTCGAAVVSWAGGAAPAPGGAFVACTLICGVLVGGADFGQCCVQASAYGDERRFLLRPPAAFVVPVAVAGLIWAQPCSPDRCCWRLNSGSSVESSRSSRRCSPGCCFPGSTRCRARWLVLVPAGVVVHDQVVLAETLMISQADVASIDLALAGTEAADFTGPASGHAVEIGLRTMVTALLAPTKTTTRGTALHVQSFLVAPTRPGAVLRTAYTA